MRRRDEIASSAGATRLPTAWEVVRPGVWVVFSKKRVTLRKSLEVRKLQAKWKVKQVGYEERTPAQRHRSGWVTEAKGRVRAVLETEISSETRMR